MRRVQFKYLDYLFEGIYEVRSPQIPNTIFFKKDNEIVFALRTRRYNKLEVSYTIWEDIQNMFSLEYYDTQDLIKEWVEQHLGLENVKPAQMDFW